MCYMPVCDLCRKPAPVGKTYCRECNSLMDAKIKEIYPREKEENLPIVINSGVNHFGSGQKE